MKASSMKTAVLAAFAVLFSTHPARADIMSMVTEAAKNCNGPGDVYGMLSKHDQPCLTITNFAENESRIPPKVLARALRAFGENHMLHVGQSGTALWYLQESLKFDPLNQITMADVAQIYAAHPDVALDNFVTRNWAPPVAKEYRQNPNAYKIARNVPTGPPAGLDDAKLCFAADSEQSIAACTKFIVAGERRDQRSFFQGDDRLDVADAYNSRGAMYARAQRYGEAAADFDRAIVMFNQGDRVAVYRKNRDIVRAAMGSNPSANGPR